MENYNCLRIADYSIGLRNMLNEEGKLYFPLHIGAFTCHDDKEEKGFNLSIEQTVGLEEPKLKPIVKVDEGPTPYYIYKDDSGNYLWFIKNRQMKKTVSFYISSDWRNFKIFPENKEEGVSVFNNFGKIFAYSLLNYNSIMFHGVLLEYKEKGIVILAPSGTGKTTHARMWRDYKKAIIINGDKTICKKVDNEWYAYGSPWFGTSGECINRKVTIDAMVILERENENRVFKLNRFDAALQLMKRMYAPTWDEKLLNNALDKINDIVNDVPILKLECLPNLDSVETLESALKNYKIIEEI